MDLADLNRLDADAAGTALAHCCASEAWVEAMVGKRPFRDVADLLAAAEEVWWGLAPDDWTEAFDAHPRIGEQPAGADTSAEWSRGEQEAIVDADADLLRAVEECNQAYEQRFGFTFVVFASDRTTEEMLDLCRSRLANGEIEELTVAAGEQARIMNLRLRKMLELT